MERWIHAPIHVTEASQHVCERGLCAGAVDGTEKEYKDDSAKGMDPEKAAKASAGGSSRGSAQFLSEVEGQRAIKVRISNTPASKSAASR